MARSRKLLLASAFMIALAGCESLPDERALAVNEPVIVRREKASHAGTRNAAMIRLPEKPARFWACVNGS